MREKSTGNQRPLLGQYTTTHWAGAISYNNQINCNYCLAFDGANLYCINLQQPTQRTKAIQEKRLITPRDNFFTKRQSAVHWTALFAGKHKRTREYQPQNHGPLIAMPISFSACGRRIAALPRQRWYRVFHNGCRPLSLLVPAAQHIFKQGQNAGVRSAGLHIWPPCNTTYKTLKSWIMTI